jgi:hypothetical protein
VGDAPIRIDLLRSGGLGGFTVQTSADTRTLAREEARELTAMVDRLDFGDLARRTRQPARGADRFHYELTVQQGAARHRVSLPESAVPAELRPLLAWLVARARGR